MALAVRRQRAAVRMPVQPERNALVLRAGRNPLVLRERGRDGLVLRERGRDGLVLRERGRDGLHGDERPARRRMPLLRRRARARAGTRSTADRNLGALRASARGRASLEHRSRDFDFPRAAPRSSTRAESRSAESSSAPPVMFRRLRRFAVRSSTFRDGATSAVLPAPSESASRVSPRTLLRREALHPRTHELGLTVP